MNAHAHLSGQDSERVATRKGESPHAHAHISAPTHSFKRNTKGNLLWVHMCADAQRWTLPPSLNFLLFLWPGSKFLVSLSVYEMPGQEIIEIRRDWEQCAGRLLSLFSFFYMASTIIKIEIEGTYWWPYIKEKKKRDWRPASNFLFILFSGSRVSPLISCLFWEVWIQK